MEFYKYHGAGNDFILLDNRSASIDGNDYSDITRRICRRRFGIGGDGVLFVEPSEVSDAKMRIFNPDGSEAEMCGNGIRCFAKYIYETGSFQEERISVETMAGVKDMELTINEGRVTYVKVDMGRPIFKRDLIPAKGTGEFIDEKFSTKSGSLSLSVINTGVPHGVVITDDLENLDIVKLGSEIRYDKIFPRGTNVNFIEQLGENRYNIRTYERGVENETLACGTGITASGVISVVLNKSDPSKTIEFRARGGTVYVDIEQKDGQITSAFMNGPVEFVFRGEIDLKE